MNSGFSFYLPINLPFVREEPETINYSLLYHPLLIKVESVLLDDINIVVYPVDSKIFNFSNKQNQSVKKA